MSHRTENDSLPILDDQSPARSPDSGQTVSAFPPCCSLGRLVTPLLLLLTTVSIGAAGYFAGRSSVIQGGASQFSGGFPLINATASATSEKYSIATGGINEDAEGLFVLDHNSGLLQCSVIYPRMGQFMAVFSINVGESLGTGGKGGQYIMVTGDVEFPRASNRPAATTVAYVMDTATGNYACYGIPFDHTLVARNQPQQGPLVLISTGSANPVIDRDKLR